MKCCGASLRCSIVSALPGLRRIFYGRDAFLLQIIILILENLTGGSPGGLICKYGCCGDGRISIIWRMNSEYFVQHVRALDRSMVIACAGPTAIYPYCASIPFHRPARLKRECRFHPFIECEQNLGISLFAAGAHGRDALCRVPGEPVLYCSGYCSGSFRARFRLFRQAAGRFRSGFAIETKSQLQKIRSCGILPAGTHLGDHWPCMSVSAMP